MKISSIPLWLFSLIFTLSIGNQGFAQAYQAVEDADVHEAFVTRVTGNILIDAHPQRPPPPIRERIPRQTDKASVWLKGYWAWSDSKQDYIWTTGVWRRPPPGHQWIEGFWKEFNDGWAWIPGFWSDKEPDKLSYINLAPPAAIDENVPSSPQENYFWNPGFWWYNPNTDQYEWVDGQWEELDPNWVLIPAHYTWRPEGYVFIDSYWDWPLDSLGEAYKPVYIPPAQRETIIYEPTRVVETTYIIDHYFYTYPDYTCFYYHHFHYNPHYWENYCCAPQWWLWDSWWGLSWSNQWGLWWWYSNPGYPAPVWITGNISSILPPPRPALYNRMQRVRPPKFVTPRGVVSPNAILNETQRISGSSRPVIPSGRAERDRIWRGVNPRGNKEIRPEGRPRPFNPNIRRPSPRLPEIQREPSQRIPRAPEGRAPRIPKRPDRTSDSRLPRPDVNQPSSRTPEDYRPPVGRPSRPRPDADRPDFGRPPGRRPSRPRPDFDRPGSRQPDAKQPETKIPDYIPPGRRPSRPRPDFDRPDSRQPDAKQPETKIPDYIPPRLRPSAPKPEINQDNFRRPSGRRPSTPRPEIDRNNFRRPQTIKPDYQPMPDRRQPNMRAPSRIKQENRQSDKPKVSYPPGFKDGPSEEIQRQTQQIQPRRNQPAEIRRQVRRKSDRIRKQAQELQKDNRENDDED